ncbi:MAG: Tn3 family transposase [Pseudomonadales bacterium]|nr:Tn3 family transposase [Pseudomonadales bacterium]
MLETPLISIAYGRPCNISIVPIVDPELFRPLSGLESKIDEPQLRLIVTLFCYGCNVGAQQTMDSIKNLSRKQVAWLNLNSAVKKLMYNANSLKSGVCDGSSTKHNSPRGWDDNER